MEKIDLQTLHKVQLDILDEVARICDENGLTYYLAFGSLIGAVRHKGYIPWDDDIDICMVREDYDRLIAILKNPQTEKAPWLSLLDNTSDNYYYPYAKAVDDRTEVKMERHTGNHGVWIDIFPLDGLSNDVAKARRHIAWCGFLRVVSLAMDANFAHIGFGWNHLYQRLFCLLATLIGKKRFCRLHERAFRKYSVADSTMIANLFTNSGSRAIMEKEKLLRSARFQFEDREYNGYANYDYCLGRMYGDYMKLPPENQRITHAFEAWWKGAGEEAAK